jgi:hypothetical protein
MMRPRLIYDRLHVLGLLSSKTARSASPLVVMVMVMVMVAAVIWVAAVVVVVVMSVACYVWVAAVVVVVVMSVACYVWVAAVAGVTAEVRVAWETAHVEVTDVADVTTPSRCQCLLTKYKT